MVFGNFLFDFQKVSTFPRQKCDYGPRDQCINWNQRKFLKVLKVLINFDEAVAVSLGDVTAIYNITIMLRRGEIGAFIYHVYSSNPSELFQINVSVCHFILFFYDHRHKKSPNEFTLILASNRPLWSTMVSSSLS